MKFGGFAIFSLGLFSGNVLAQEDQQIEEITVTGSRIARDANLSGALPVQTVGEQEIQLSGEFSLTDVVNDIPALLSSTSSESSIDSAFADGANILNLRGLGSNRTLVLVDGRRHVGGVQGTAAVDVGSIPMRLVERVEVLTGGASAIYGADAVTGVVNFILKDDYEGFNIDASYGLSSRGDAAQTALTATWGTNFAGDRGNIAVSVDYRTDDGLLMGDRPVRYSVLAVTGPTRRCDFNRAISADRHRCSSSSTTMTTQGSSTTACQFRMLIALSRTTTQHLVRR
jgi:iron complex outermembrane recepter protein